jgi:hypothetical protein
MKDNKLLISGIVASIVYFVLSYLCYGLLFINYFNENSVMAVDLSAIKWWANILGTIAWGFLFAYALGKANVSSIGAGATMGLVLGLLLELSFDFGLYSVGQGYKTLSALCFDVVLTAVICAILGAVIVWSYGLGKKGAA